MNPKRLQLPTLFDGDWDSALIVTYGAELEFFERDLLRQLARARNRIVLADSRQVVRKLSDPQAREQLRQINRTYVLGPIRIERAAHAKLILLLSEERGMLAVGSGNLGMNGYASQGECFTTYRWSPDDPEHLREFLAARTFVDRIGTLDLVDQVIRTRIKQAWANAPWLYGLQDGTPPAVRHNLDTGLLDQFIEAIEGRSVDELVVHAPFYDHRCRALRELIDRTSPDRLQVLLQERLTSVDPDQLAKVLARFAGDLDVRSVQAEEKGTFLHAKFIIARCGRQSVCVQGSPNLSTPALLNAHPDGNIELANLLTGDRAAFDHLVDDLVLSSGNVDVSTMGLGLVVDESDESEDDTAMPPIGLSWVSPNLSGTFQHEVRAEPQLLIDGLVVDDATWTLGDPENGTTGFSVRLGEDAAAAVDRVAAISFDFGDGVPSSPTFPYHLRTLTALASGQGRTDLLKQAGDFDLDDEELEDLLAQLDEVLVVDGRSIWRMLKRQDLPSEDDDASTIAYEDLDWNAIQAHPKLAQYRDWSSRSASDPTALGILLTSITERFEADIERRRSGASPGAEEADALSELGSVFEPENEEEAEQAEEDREKRRVSARARARRQFHGFIDRFVTGLQDEEFVRNVGPSVVIPSYVVFNHLCWKLIQIELVDPMRIIGAQIELWNFVWGDAEHAGYLAQMTTDEQEAALEILERHHSESVLLCALFQAFDHSRHGDDDESLVQIRDAWRTILVHDLWQPSRSSVLDSATLLEPGCESAIALVANLRSLASLVTSEEPLTAVAAAASVHPHDVALTSGRVQRGPLGERDVPIYAVEKSQELLSPSAAGSLLATLHAMNPDDDYIRIEDRENDAVAFADFELGTHVYANRSTDELEELVLPVVDDPPWVRSIEALYTMAETAVAA